MHWRRKWQPTPVFLPGESQGREAWWAAVSGVAQSQTRLRRLSSSSSSSLLVPPSGQQSQFSSVQSLSHVRLFSTPWIAARQAPHPSPTPGAHVNSCPFSPYCHPTISSSVVPFSSCPQSFLASGSFLRSQLFASGGQSIGVSASTSVLPMNTQDWSPWGWTGWISLQSKGLFKSFL